MIELRSDQREVAKRLVEVLKTHPVVGFQAPTGWGKTPTVLEVVEEFGGPALWLAPRLAIAHHVYVHAVRMNMRVIATAGRERLCAYNHSMVDFLRGVCNRCPLNRPVSINGLKYGSMDFGEVRSVAESLGVCPYRMQGVLERYGNYDLVISHYNRIQRLRALRPKLIVVDESHNVAIPRMHEVRAGALEVVLEKLGFGRDEISAYIRSPETLKVVLGELIDSLVYIVEDVDDALRPVVEELLSMVLGAQVWYYNETEGSIVGLELPSIADITNTHSRVLFMSATLPPSLLSLPNVIVRRNWSIPVRLDARYAITVETIQRRRDELVRYIGDKYLKPNTIVFTTSAREVLLSDRDEVVWEDELGSDPCQYKEGIVALRVFGKYNEGVDIGCFDNVVVLGYPILPYAMERLKARGITEEDFTTMVTTQIIGRVTRTAERPMRTPNITLVDKRFKRITDKLRQYEIEVIND